MSLIFHSITICFIVSRLSSALEQKSREKVGINFLSRDYKEEKVGIVGANSQKKRENMPYFH